MRYYRKCLGLKVIAQFEISCRKCGEKKPLVEFPRVYRRGKTIQRHSCRDCCRKYNASWMRRRRHPEAASGINHLLDHHDAYHRGQFIEQAMRVLAKNRNQRVGDLLPEIHGLANRILRPSVPYGEKP